MRARRILTKAGFWLVVVLTPIGMVSVSSSGMAAVIGPGSLTATQSGKDLVLSFPTASRQLYTVQTSPDLQQPWTSLQPAISGDGTTKTLTVSNAISGGEGFYRLLIQTPTQLTLPQSLAFEVIGHSCGGIKEQVYVTGFDPISGGPVGQVNLSTTCSTGGRGSLPHTYTASAAVTWDLTGTVISSGALSNAVPTNPTFIATDAHGDSIYNENTAAFLVVPIPAAPIDVNAVQSGDEFQVSWAVNGVNPAAITSSIVTATPVNSTASALTTNVTGQATAAVIPTLQPDTTYQITVVDATIGGSSPASTPISVTTSVASILPSAPTGVTASWLIADPSGTNDTIVVNWEAAVPGDSPVDQYQVTISGSDGGGTFVQTVPGTTLTASFNVDDIPNWSVSVKAHNAVGWGPSSSVVSLGGL